MIQVEDHCTTGLYSYFPTKFFKTKWKNKSSSPKIKVPACNLVREGKVQRYRDVKYHCGIGPIPI
ncbi:unnamed protein product [Arabidopsis lyrata]|nr:unnamed protein product [Arabidopsis lyrata]